MRRPKSIRDWQAMFFAIYGERNRELYSVPEILNHVFEAMAELVEELRKENRDGIIAKIPDLFAWILGLGSILEIDLEEAVWHKYPNICPYCLQKKNCICISRQLKYRPNIKKLETYRIRVNNIPTTLYGWQKMFDRIYGGVNTIKSQLQLWLHLFEELGEISKALHQRKGGNLEAELADTLAWLFAVCTKLRISLSELAWEIYPGKCRVCLQGQCQCPKD